MIENEASSKLNAIDLELPAVLNKDLAEQAEKSLGFRTIRSVQQALIRPPAFKLFLLNVAIHVNSKTGVAYPGLSLLARECSLSMSHTKRLLRTAKETGILRVVSQGSGRISNRYQFDLDALDGYVSESKSAAPPEVLARLRESVVKPDSTVNWVHGGTLSQPTLELGAGSPMSTKPQRPQRPQSLGEGGGTTTSGSASPPPWVVPELPEELDIDMFTKLVNMGPPLQPRVDLLAQAAFDLVAGGKNVNALAKESIKLGLKSWCDPEKAGRKNASRTKQRTPVSKKQNPSDLDTWGGY